MRAPDAKPNPILDWLGILEDTLLTILLTAMILLAGAQILLRNFLDESFPWGDPLLRVMVLWVGLLGAVAATRDNYHIRIDLLSRFLPDTGQWLARLTRCLFTSAVSGLMAWHSGRFVLMEREEQLVAFADIPIWICEAIIPFAFAIITLHALVNFFDCLRSGPRAEKTARIPMEMPPS